MLDPGLNGTSGLSHNYEANVRSQESIQATMQRTNTVKELLMLKRQKWNCSKEDNCMEHTFKSAKQETCTGDASPHTLGPHVPVNPNTPTHFPPACPDSVHLKHMQSPAHWGNVAQTAEIKISLFYWQIQQAEQKVGDISPELLTWQDADGDTYLHIAVAQGRRALAYVLAGKMAKCGALDVKEHNGQTALQIATAINHHLIVRDLLAHGAQINTHDFWGRSPLHVCSEKGHFLSLQTICNSFFESGQTMDVDIFNYDGLTPLHTAVLFHNKVIKELRPLESPCSYLVIELMQRKHMFIKCIQTLLLMGASLTTKDLKSGRTCLHMASEEANMELLQLFLDQPQSLSVVNVKTFSGNTALHIVSALQNHKSQVEAVKLLMRKGADPGARNYENELPSQLVPGGPIDEKVRQILKGKGVYA
ncbi:NF-kappa-B inhibitor zeta isoform X2 [Paralichthys olivaceus]|uniref:NF-kappa-B inhibitor zeta isoform X2 n=1 Tax=Paralichthys olivaceus TaxID=8255 RepID=UPI00097D6D8E|nr:PREDICTED: NF-kappa-B inhibitor zeta-like [Paralichthys olivaceus]